jgi:hypothetical protein
VAAQHRERDLQLQHRRLRTIIRAATPTRGPEAINEPVLVLDVRQIQLRGALDGDRMGQLIWGGAGAATALYSHRRERLTIHEITRDGALIPAETTIEVSCLPVFGRVGVRPWLICPCQCPSGPCGRRALKLYLPPGETVFRCRSCLGPRGHFPALARVSQLSAHSLQAIAH